MDLVGLGGEREAQQVLIRVHVVFHAFCLSVSHQRSKNFLVQPFHAAIERMLLKNIVQFLLVSREFGIVHQRTYVIGVYHLKSDYT